RGQLNRQLSDQVFRHRGLAKDFRVAMVQLCMAKLSGGADGANTVQVLTDWLTGRNRRIGAVKPYMIFNTINRTNARYIFESLLNWIRFAGHSGLLVMLDMARVTTSHNPRDGFLYYSRASVLDSYEVLRQFIDSIDRLQGCLILVSPDIPFLSEEVHERGFGAYEALKFRIVDEVRDRQLANPMSSLIRLVG
ncbi:MAG: ATP-binding protein, partial [Nitrososphaera sp.]|nr:ATP-binding protein [Nitrososphaera sp.]